MRSPSIKIRLTLFYGLTTIVLLSVTVLFLYLVTMHILHKANEQFLTDEIKVLKKILVNQPDNFLALKQEVIEVPDTETGSEYRYYIRILDQNRNIVLQTPLFSQTFTNAIFFNQLPVGNKKEAVHWNSAGHKYALMQTQSTIGHTNKLVLIQVALDITYQQNIIAQFSKLLIFTLLLIILCAILLGYLIASRAISSLYRLTEVTQQITVASLHQRIDPKYWPQELRSLGMAFNEMLARIENAFLQLTQFSADLAHELRTPINNLMGEAEIVLSRTHSIDDYKAVLESHLEELQRISHIIENILFLARTENPKLDIKKEWIHVSNEIHLLCEFYQAMADEKNIRITSKGDASLHANPIMFRRMLSNLLSNALKYTPEGGYIQFTTKEDSHLVEMTLQDNGIGIAPEHLPKLFNRFYRADSARARSAGGIGLGLSIVKSIIELHQGTISITSEIEKGTTIKIVIPK